KPKPSSTRRTCVEAIILAGGKAERLGDAAEGRPKALVPVGRKPLVGYQVARLAAAGVDRVIVSCAAGQGQLFLRELAGFGAEVVAAEEPERLGRGGGIRFAARERRESGPVLALNGDELLDGDFVAPRARRPRDDDLPEARRRGPPARLPPRGALADREHAEGPAPRGGADQRRSTVACAEPGVR